MESLIKLIIHDLVESYKMFSGHNPGESRKRSEGNNTRCDPKGNRKSLLNRRVIVAVVDLIDLLIHTQNRKVFSLFYFKNLFFSSNKKLLLRFFFLFKTTGIFTMQFILSFFFCQIIPKKMPHVQVILFASIHNP